MSVIDFSPTSAQDYHHHVSQWIGPFNVHAASWPEDATQIRYSPLTNTAVLKGRYMTELEIRETRNKRYYVLHIPLDGSMCFYVGGKEKVINRTEALMVYPGMDVELVFHKNCEALVLCINAVFFLNNLSVSGVDTSVESRPVEGYSINMTQTPGTLVTQAIEHLLAQPRATGELAEYLGFINQLEARVSRRIINALGLATSASKATPGQAGSARQIVSEAVRYIQNHIEESISTAQIARHCGISSRTLQRAFMKEHGVSPLTWVKQTRLHGVRHELTHPNSSGNKNVTNIAMTWGFNDLGRFSAQYRAYFGELPSQTLRVARTISESRTKSQTIHV